MQSEMTKDIEVRPSSFVLWFGILAGPIAFAIDLQLRYALIPWACRAGSRWILTGTSVPLLVVAVVAGVLAWRGWDMGEEEETPVPQRVRFMAIGGVILSALFALSIVAVTIPDFFLTPCN